MKTNEQKTDAILNHAQESHGMSGMLRLHLRRLIIEALDLKDDRQRELSAEDLQEIINHQIWMNSLWPLEPTITEHLLVSALRHLHAVIERDSISAQIAKDVYWDLESEL